MNTKIGQSNQESSILAVSSAGGTASSSTAPLPLHRPHQEHRLQTRAEGTPQSAAATTAFRDSFEEANSSESLSASLDCGVIKSINNKLKFHSEFIGRLEEFGDETDDTSVGSDTESFYSVESHLTPQNHLSDVSLSDLDNFSESTLYNSTRSLNIHTPSHSSFLRTKSYGNLNSTERDISDFSLDYTSCPDLSPTGLSSTQACETISNVYLNNRAQSQSLPLINKVDFSFNMSAVDGNASPRVGDEIKTKKKRGLMSSFRKSRKTSRKLRQQNKDAADGDTASGTGVASDGESENFPSESNSIDNINITEDTTLDSHQPTHERLNGTELSKDTSEPNSKDASPVIGKSNKFAETAKKCEEKEDKKAIKSKFGGSLFHKKKAEPVSSTPPTQDISKDVVTSETPDTKEDGKGEELKAETESPTTSDTQSEQTIEVLASEETKPAEPKISSFRSYITNVQLLKNLTVRTEEPKAQQTSEALTKTGLNADEVYGKKAVEAGTGIAPKWTGTTTIETKMITASSANVKPSATEAGASTDKREHLYKILVIGELGTGKTSIIKRYVHQFFSQHYRATIGVDFALKVLNWDNNTVIRLQLWDIAGQERFGNMTRVYYKEAVGAFVVFDVTRAQTFDAITKWKTDLDTKVTLADGSPIPAVLLANKCDQPKEGVVNNPARMDDYCRERGFSGWFETSAKENINIDEASRFLVNKILTNEKEGMMMTESMDTEKFSVDGKVNPVDKSGCRC